MALNEEAGLAIDADTILPMWSGDRLDLGWAVTSLWYSNHPEARAAARRAGPHQGLDRAA